MSDPTYIVYHYCTVETFQNLMKSKVLWLCDLTDSNDDQEITRTFVTLWEGVKKRLKATDLDRELLDAAIEIIDQQYQIEVKTDPPYGICFCQKEDLLSQWKEYGDSTKGLSIGFDISWFIKNGIRWQRPHPNGIQSKAIGCEKVIYHSDIFEEEMANLCYNELKRNGVEAWLMRIRPTFKHYSGYVKNPTFEAEQEIRIVYYPIEGEDFIKKDVEVSELKTNVKKHYEIPWAKQDSQALKSICIGHNCSLKRSEILDLLLQNGIHIDGVSITESQCSYRVRE